MSHLETSFRHPTFTPAEPCLAFAAAGGARRARRAAARQRARHRRAPGVSLPRAGEKSRRARARSRGQGRVQREAARRLGGARAPRRPAWRATWHAARRRRRVGCRRVAGGLVRKIRPCLRRRHSRGSRCGCRPSGIASRSTNFPMPMTCSCRARVFFPLNPT